MSVKKIRPYARLITMLGEQLIKNEQFALSEIVKNSYDADADWVKVSFEGFDNHMHYSSDSKIVIEDNGDGMTEKIILENWMNPATYNKRNELNEEPKRTDKDRIIQGEKGIGRFSLFKLGKHVKVVTRPKGGDLEYTITYDFTIYDDDFTKKLNKDTGRWEEKKIFLDEVDVLFEPDIPTEIVVREVKVNHTLFSGNNHGTRIEISNLKGRWTYKKYRDSFRELSEIQSSLDKLLGKTPKSEFEIGFSLNDEDLYLDKEESEHLSYLIENRAVISISDGKFDNERRLFTFKLDGEPSELSLDSPKIRGLSLFRNSIWGHTTNNMFEQMPNIGNYRFHFYIFDFAAKDPSKYHLDKNDKKLLKKHRVYLFRDDIRVYPYGSPFDDWLQIDIHRGTVRAGDFVSNDQTLGWIEIGKKANPQLRDKTNREGLIEYENITQAFIDLNKIFLSYVRTNPYKKYQIDNKRVKDSKTQREEQMFMEFDKLSNALTHEPKKQELLDDIKTMYLKERGYMERRVELTEELAGVGLSVETASHDLMLMLTKGLGGIHDLTKEVMNKSRDCHEIEEELNKLSGMFTFVKNQMQDIQLLYTSSKRRRKQLRVKDLLEKVAHFYARVLKKAGIEYEIEVINSPLIAKCTDAVLMQTLINLFDNSFYWLKISDQKDKRILIQLDGMRNRMIFSDNGPGLHADDIPYLFEPFYSGKGDEGRGLGLYISRKLLNKNDYEIEVADLKSEKLLSGANFVIDFNTETN